MYVRGKLIRERITRPAATGTGGVAALHHETGNDTVESGAVIIALPGQEYEVVYGLRHILREQLDYKVPFAGLNRAVYFSQVYDWPETFSIACFCHLKRAWSPKLRAASKTAGSREKPWIDIRLSVA
jgi:hypothetical protein